MARLLYNDHAGRQQALRLDPSRPQIVLGRQSDCDIIVHDTSVSRRHCVIVPEEGGFAVVDLGSANGTLVNDVRVTRRRLADNDVIRCGIYAVRFVEGQDAAEQAHMTLRDRYRRRGGEGPARTSLDRLQALTESQAQRLVQLQDELVRVDAERNAAIELSGRQESELQAARMQLQDLQLHLRHVAGALKHREAELAAARGEGPAPGEPPQLTAPPAGMAEAEAAATNHALRAEIAQLEGALSTEDAFLKASRVVPAVDRWQAVEIHQRAARDARAVAAELRRSLDAAERRARATREGTPSDSAIASRIATLEDKLRAAEKGRADAERKLAQSARKKPPVSKPPPAQPGVGASKASVFGQVGNRGGLLSGLGGLGRTAGTANSADSELPKPLSDRFASLGRQAELNRQAEERDRRETRIRELQAELEQSTRARETAQRSAEVLAERLDALRGSGASGLSALQLAECLDLAAKIRDVLDP